jgi:hypothetical protein
MPYFNAETPAAALGDFQRHSRALERYLREGGTDPV